MVALGGLLRRFQTPFRVEARVLDHQVVNSDGSCVWEIEVEVSNMTDRRVSLQSARLSNLDGSDSAILASVPPAGSTVRTYRYPLPDCSTDPEALGAGSLVLHIRPSGSSLNKFVTAEID